MKKNVKANASRQNAAKKIYVPQVMVVSISGVTRPMIKFDIQVQEVVMEIALERIESG